MKNYRILDILRRGRTDLENHLIDGLVDGRVSRREFIRHGSLLGLSLPFLGSVGFAAGFGGMPSLARAQGTPGATIRVASSVPAAAIEPVSVADAGGLLMLQQVGEFLCLDGPDLVLKPMLAESWKPNDKGDVWTFTLRKGVKFHSGGEMKADDVVASIDRLADPANSSNALSVFTGFLQKGATKKSMTIRSSSIWMRRMAISRIWYRPTTTMRLSFPRTTRAISKRISTRQVRSSSKNIRRRLAPHLSETMITGVRRRCRSVRNSPSLAISSQ